MAYAVCAATGHARPASAARHTDGVTETGDDATPPPAPDDGTDLVSAPPTEAESVEDYYARIAAAAGEDGRLPVAVEEMPGWDIYPYELEGLRLKPVRPPADEEPARRGEQASDC